MDHTDERSTKGNWLRRPQEMTEKEEKEQKEAKNVTGNEGSKKEAYDETR